MVWKNPSTLQKDPDIDMPEKKTYTKRLVKWGLLQRVALPDKPWALCIFADSIFDSLEAALARANEYNTHDGSPAYLYKPVELLVTAEVDSRGRGGQIR